MHRVQISIMSQHFSIILKEILTPWTDARVALTVFLFEVTGRQPGGAAEHGEKRRAEPLKLNEVRTALRTRLLHSANKTSSECVQALFAMQGSLVFNQSVFI